MGAAVVFPSFSGRRFPRRAGAQRSQKGGPQVQSHVIPENERTYSHTYNKNDDLIGLFRRTTPPILANFRRFRRENDHCNNSVTYAIKRSFLTF